MMLKFAFGVGTYSVRKTLLRYMKSRITSCCCDQEIHYLRNSSSVHIANNVLSPKQSHSDSNHVVAEEVSKRRPRLPWVMSEDVRGYLLERPENEDIVNNIPKKLFRKNRVFPENIYLADKEIAGTIASALEKHVRQKGSIVLEINPGLGIFSKKLIDIGVDSLHLYEPNATFFSNLKELEKCHRNVSVFRDDLLSFWKMTFLDKVDNGTRVKDILSRYPEKDWIEDSPLKIIAAIQTPNLITHLILSLTTQSGIMVHCRPEFFILMPPSLHTQLTCSGSAGYFRYRSTSVLFQLFFECENLEKLPRKVFLPWLIYPPSKRKRPELELQNEEWLYLVRVIPRKDLYVNVAPPEKLRQLWFFVRHHLRSRNSRLISEMEQWIPGCGIRLILEGYNIFTEIGELSPQEILHVYKSFISWPEFQVCSFLSNMETTIVKLEESSGGEIAKIKALSNKQNQVEDDENEDLKKDNNIPC